MRDQCSLDATLLEDLRVGPLGPHLEGFLATLRERGYTRSAAKEKIRIVSRLSQWLQRRRLAVEDLNESTIEKFVSCRKGDKRLGRVGPSTFRQLLSFLREEDFVPVPLPAVEDSPIQRIESGFTQHLVAERGLTQDTVRNYLPTVRRFLIDRFSDGKIMLKSLCPQDISTFLIRYAHTMSPGRAQLMVAALRSFFRFLLTRGNISTDLALQRHLRHSTLYVGYRDDGTPRDMDICFRSVAAVLVTVDWNLSLHRRRWIYETNRRGADVGGAFRRSGTGRTYPSEPGIAHLRPQIDCG